MNQSSSVTRDRSSSFHNDDRFSAMAASAAPLEQSEEEYKMIFDKVIARSSLIA
jgi:hypothetical protein